MSGVPHQLEAPGGVPPPGAATRSGSNAGSVTFLLAYPVLIPIGFYTTWFVGRLAIGHWPRPNLDQPDTIGGATKFVHGATLSLVTIGLPLFAIATVVACRAARRAPDRHRCLACAAALGALSLIAGIVFLGFDPNHVVDWFFG